MWPLHHIGSLQQTKLEEQMGRIETKLGHMMHTDPKLEVAAC